MSPRSPERRRRTSRSTTDTCLEEALKGFDDRVLTEQSSDVRYDEDGDDVFDAAIDVSETGHDELLTSTV